MEWNICEKDLNKSYKIKIGKGFIKKLVILFAELKYEGELLNGNYNNGDLNFEGDYFYNNKKLKKGIF